MRTMPAQRPGQSRQDYATPDDFFDAVVRRWGPMLVDLAASEENARADAYYDEEADSLNQNWTELVGRLWLNPPYANISDWAEKCAKSFSVRRHIFFLVPASIGSEWFAKWISQYARVYALRGRLTFKGCAAPYPKDCILAVYGEEPGFQVWDWRREMVAP